MRIQSDSRKIRPGDIFIALRGIERDGHSFIQKAIENGAAKIVAEEGTYDVETQIVPNTRIYLREFLKQEYSQQLKDLTLVGVTGTNGKTTTAYLLYTMLNYLGLKSTYVGNLGFSLDDFKSNLLNNTNELIDNYEMMMRAKEAGVKNFIMEVSSQGLDMYGANRVDGLLYDYAIFTNLTRDHLDYHKTMENYALAKRKLFEQLKPTGLGIINYDDFYKDQMIVGDKRNTLYGFTGGDYEILSHNMTNNDICFTYKHNEEEYTIAAPILGKFNIYNLIGALIVMHEMGINPEKIKEAALHVTPPSGRVQMVPINNTSIAVIDYAHTPDAMLNLMQVMSGIVKGNIYTVFGCTGDRDREKRPMMMDIALTFSKRVIITNDDPHFEDPNQIVSDMLKNKRDNHYDIELDRKKAIEKGISMIDQDDALLILGKGHERFMIVGNEKIPFHDYDVVMDLIKQES